MKFLEKIRTETPWMIWSVRDNFDGWFRWHLWGTYALTDMGDRWWVGVFGAFLWEGCDVWWWRKCGMKYEHGLKPNHIGYDIEGREFLDNVFDRRGASWMDLAFGCVAVGLWVIRTEVIG